MNLAPRRVVCARTSPARASQLCTTNAPARFTGVEPPAIPIESTLTVAPFLAAVMMTSHTSAVSLSGLIGQVLKVTGQRSSKFSSPTAAFAISIMYWVSFPLPPPVNTCLVVFISRAS